MFANSPMEQNKHKSMPITELSNETTIDIDLSDSTGIVRLLRQCDAQMFSGWRDHPCLYDKETLVPLEILSKHIQQAIRDPDNHCVVFSGCGTSGRIGFMLAKKFNALAEEQGISGLYNNIIAGGKVALFSSVEMPEDDWCQGQLDLAKLVKDKKRVVFVGITCGFSAQYVAGQLDYCMNNPDTFVPALLGFNPVHFASRTSMEGCDKTFFDVAKRLSEHKDGIIINPVVGPEAITGSSRMKGGSATKILLETALIKAHSEALTQGLHIDLCSIIQTYESVFRETYLHIEKISKAVSFAGESLRKSRHVYYLAWGSPSFVAIVDASECVPTFSSSFNDVRAFVKGGFDVLGIVGAVLIGGFEVHLSIEHFVKDVLPNQLSKDDTVVVTCLSSKYLEEVTEVVNQVFQKKANIVGLLSQDCKNIENFLDISIKINENYKLNSFLQSMKVQECFSDCLNELAVKLMLNALSTGGHVLKGKILRSLMIDVKVSNNKLFRRAVGIVSELSHVSENEAFAALLKAIYRKDAIPESTRNDVISSHVSVGTLKDKVVPLAILLATGRFNIESGLMVLEEKTVAQVLKELHFI